MEHRGYPLRDELQVQPFQDYLPRIVDEHTERAYFLRSEGGGEPSSEVNGGGVPEKEGDSKA